MNLMRVHAGVLALDFRGIANAFVIAGNRSRVGNFPRTGNRLLVIAINVDVSITEGLYIEMTVTAPRIGRVDSGDAARPWFEARTRIIPRLDGAITVDMRWIRKN